MDIGTAIFLMVIVGLVVWRISTLISGNRRRTSYGGVHSTPPIAPTPASPSTVKVMLGQLNSRKYLLILGGVAVALVITILLIMFIKEDATKIIQGADVKFVVATLVVIALAVLGAMGKAGGPGKWALGIVAILAILLFLSEVVIRVGYGDQADEVKRAMRERSVQEVLAPKPKAGAAQTEVIQRVPLVQRIPMTLTTSWSKGVRVMGDQCIQWWGENPTGYDVQASGPIPLWKDWAEWKRARAAGKLGDPWQFRFKAKEGTLDLEYEIRGRDQCNKK